MLTFAGEELVAPSPQILAQLGQELNLFWSSHDGPWSFPFAPGGDPALGRPGLWPPHPPDLNVLYWPAGASRWACGWFLADELALAAARNLNGVAGTWTFADGVSSVSTELLLLPPIPLHRVSLVVPSLYLLPLVDERYYWWEKVEPPAITPGTTTWEEAIENLALAMGVTITVDDVDAAYLYPSASLGLPRGPLPPCLDLLCAAVGRRVVRSLDGTVRGMSAQNSLDAHRLNLSLRQGDRLSGRRLEYET